MKWILALLVVVLGIFMINQKHEVKLPKNSKILAFGDSLTFGYGASKNKSYPAQLAKLLNIEVINRGISGEVSSDGLKRFSKVLHEVSPDILILCHGGNDILRKQNLLKTKQNLKTMIEMAQKKNIRVVLVGVPKWNGLFGVGTAEIYDELADEMDVEYEGKVLEDIESSPSLKSDQIHPNDEGYKKMAEAFRDILLKI